MESKRGWIRIAEAVAGIMIFSGVLIFIYSQNSEKADISDFVYETQKFILEGIAFNSTLRADVLGYDVVDVPLFEGNNAPESIVKFVNKSLESDIGFEVKVCEINNLVCNLNKFVDSDVFAEERIISANLTNSSMKKVRLFVWFK